MNKFRNVLFGILLLAGIVCTTSANALAYNPRANPGPNGTYQTYFPNHGDIVMCDESPAVYRVLKEITNIDDGSSDVRHPYVLTFKAVQYPNEAVFRKDGQSFSKIQHISCDDLHDFYFGGIANSSDIGGILNEEPFSSLIKFPDSPTVYLLNDRSGGCFDDTCLTKLRAWAIPDEQTAALIDGQNWNKHIVVLDSWTRADIEIIPNFAEWKAKNIYYPVVTFFKASDHSQAYMIDDFDLKTLVSYYTNGLDSLASRNFVYVISDEEFAKWVVVRHYGQYGIRID